MRHFALAILWLLPVGALHAQVDWKHLSSATGDLPAPLGSVQQTACVVADFNQDGIDDPVVASRGSGGRVEVWLSSPAGPVRDTIEPTDVSPEAGGTAFDIDGDGDVDLVLGQDTTGTEIHCTGGRIRTRPSALHGRDASSRAAAATSTTIRLMATSTVTARSNC